jgi:hypothetical protein
VDEDFVKEVTLILNDLVEGQKVVLAAFAERMEANGMEAFKAEMGAACDYLAAKIERVKPEHPLGDRRADTLLARGLADALLPPQSPPTAWRPIVIQGGRE